MKEIVCMQKRNVINSLNSKIKYCYGCKKKLIEGVNISKASLKIHQYNCKDCERIFQRNKLMTVNRNGEKVDIYIDKRKFPNNNKCEMCGFVFNTHNYRYHHWNDSHPEFGIWCCGKCHWIVESIETIKRYKKIIAKYLQLKQEIENGKA